MKNVVDKIRELVDCHRDTLAKLAEEATIGMSDAEIAQSIEDGRREIAANLHRRGIDVDFLL